HFDLKAVQSPDGLIVWHAATYEKAFAVPAQAGTVCSLAFSPDSKRLALASFDNTVELLELPSGQRLCTLTTEAKPPLAGSHTMISSHPSDGKMYFVSSQNLAFSPDGEHLAFLNFDGGLRVWDARTGQSIFSRECRTLFGHAATFSPDSQRLVSAGPGK